MTVQEEITEITERLAEAGYPLLNVATLSLGQTIHSVWGYHITTSHKIRGMGGIPLDAYYAALYEARKHFAQVKGLEVSEHALRARVQLRSGNPGKPGA